MSALQDSQVSSAAGPAGLSAAQQRAAVTCGCIVAFAYSANYTTHAPLAPALMREFGFNQALAGLLTTGIFATHAGMQLPGGYLVDRLGSKRVLLFALAWVALGNIGMAFAGAYWQLRSEERRVGKEGRCRWWTSEYRKDAKMDWRRDR